MNERNNAVARREALIAQCDRQRAELTAELQAMRSAMTPAGIGVGLLETVRHHKWLMIGGALALAFIKPRRLVAGLEMGLVGWGVWQKFAPMFQKVCEHFGKDGGTAAQK